MAFKLLIKNLVLFFSLISENYSFYSNIRKFKKKQIQILFNCLNKNKNTVFGKIHQFHSIKNLDQFRNLVPIQKYDEYKMWINQIELGQKNILTSEEIELLEPTGGSSGGTKLIPYSKELLKSFHKGIAVWLFDLYFNYPKLIFLKSYWIITPNLCENQVSKGGIPIGFYDDSKYLGKIAPYISDIFVYLNIPITHQSGVSFQYAAIRLLLENKNLGLISIWHPSMLLLFIATFDKYSALIIEDISNGTLSNPLSKGKIAINKSNNKRAMEIKETLHHPLFWEKIFPHLQVISCWGEATAEWDAKKLEKKFPNTFFQYKGLLATEGIMTIPILKSKGNIPAFLSHFFEFIEVDQKEVVSLFDLKLKKKYKVILTNLGGLYRYDMGDIIEVQNFWKGLPVIKFLGRDSYSDLVGEKISEIQVGEIIKILNEKYLFHFILLAPGMVNDKPHYILFIEFNEILISPNEFIKLFEKELDTNFYYRQAKITGQLGALRVFRIIENGQEKYFERKLQSGQKLGDIKPKFLDTNFHWEDYFTGEFID